MAGLLWMEEQLMEEPGSRRFIRSRHFTRCSYVSDGLGMHLRGGNMILILSTVNASIPVQPQTLSRRHIRITLELGDRLRSGRKSSECRFQRSFAVRFSVLIQTMCPL